MTIKVYPDRIEFNTFTITNTPTGIDINGTFNAVQWNGYSNFGGTVSGYSSGGRLPSPDVSYNVIDKFSFASSTINAIDAGDLTVSRGGSSGQSSNTSGYTSGGRIPPAPAGYSNVIDKFPFASVVALATDVGDLTATARSLCGQSSSISGYSSGGQGSSTINKFPFAADVDATSIGPLTVIKEYSSGQSSSTNGYTAGGYGPAATNNIIDKFPFANDNVAADVGDLTATRYGLTGQSSSTFGYASGGQTNSNVIDKFSFSTDGNATDVGDLTVSRYTSAGQSSSTHGYTSGGDVPPVSNVIDRFSFSTDGNATDVGDITTSRAEPVGQQV